MNYEHSDNRATHPNETMKKLFAILCFLTFAQFSLADEQGIATAESHLGNLLRGDIPELSKSYAAKVLLMPGHEFLKTDYGLAKDGDRAIGLEVDRGKLVATMKQAAAERRKRPAERINKFLATVRYEVLKTKVGDFATDAADPVGTPDGKLHFTIEKGDLLLKVAPPKGDFLYLHLRKLDDEWRVVSEYLD